MTTDNPMNIARRAFMKKAALTGAALALGGVATSAIAKDGAATERSSQPFELRAENLPERTPEAAMKWSQTFLEEIIEGKRRAPDEFVEGMRILAKENPEGFEKAVAQLSGSILDLPEDIEPSLAIIIHIHFEIWGFEVDIWIVIP